MRALADEFAPRDGTGRSAGAFDGRPTRGQWRAFLPAGCCGCGQQRPRESAGMLGRIAHVASVYLFRMLRRAGDERTKSWLHS